MVFVPPKTPVLEIQGAIYERLTTDVTLMALISGVFDWVPEGSAYPYIAIGEAMETPENSHGSFGRETLSMLHIWTRQRGYADGIEIADRVNSLLDHCHATGNPLVLPNHDVISVRFEFLQTLPDEDPEIRHIVLHYRICTEQE